MEKKKEKKKKNKSLHCFACAVLTLAIAVSAIANVITSTESVAKAEYNDAQGSLVLGNSAVFSVDNYTVLSSNSFSDPAGGYDPILPVTFNCQVVDESLAVTFVLREPNSTYLGQYNLSVDTSLTNFSSAYDTWLTHTTVVNVFTESGIKSGNLRYMLYCDSGFVPADTILITYGNKRDMPLDVPPAPNTSTFGYSYNYVKLTDLNGKHFVFTWCPLSTNPGSTNAYPSNTYLSEYYLLKPAVLLNNGSNYDRYYYNVGFDDGKEEGIRYAVENDLGKMDSLGTWVSYFTDVLQTDIFGFISVGDLLLIVLGVGVLGFIFKLLAV